MRILTKGFDLNAFFAHVSAAAKRALLLDYDGTLAPFVLDPRQAAPYPGVLVALEDLVAAGHTRLVIVSGRWTRDLLPLLKLRARPEIWGVHGRERLMPDGRYEIEEVPEATLEVLETADAWAERLAALGARLERKPASIAFHWRGQPEPQIASIRRELERRWASFAGSTELGLHEFDGGMELRALGRDKGAVVRTLAAECGEGGVIAYLGDDHTDEDAFRAVPESGAAALVRETFRPTTAQLWLKPPDELVTFLRRWTVARSGP